MGKGSSDPRAGIGTFSREGKLKSFQKTVTERWQAELKRQAVEKLIAEVRELEKSDPCKRPKRG